MNDVGLSFTPPGLVRTDAAPRLTPWAIFFRLFEAAFRRTPPNFRMALGLVPATPRSEAVRGHPALPSIIAPGWGGLSSARRVADRAVLRRCGNGLQG